MSTYKAGRHFLQIPGPSNVPDWILHAIGQPTIDHRGPEFRKLSGEVLIGSRRMVADRVFRIGHLGDLNDLTVIGTLAGVEKGWSLAVFPMCGTV